MLIRLGKALVRGMKPDPRGEIDRNGSKQSGESLTQTSLEKKGSVVLKKLRQGTGGIASGCGSKTRGPASAKPVTVRRGKNLVLDKGK